MAALLAHARAERMLQLLRPESFRCSAARVSAVVRELDIVMGDSDGFLSVVFGVWQSAYD